MMDSFFATLEARDPSLGRMRSYRLEAGTDLLGAWLVDVVYGRIGARGAHLLCSRGCAPAREQSHRRRPLRRRRGTQDPCRGAWC